MQDRVGNELSGFGGREAFMAGTYHPLSFLLGASLRTTIVEPVTMQGPALRNTELTTPPRTAVPNNMICVSKSIKVRSTRKTPPGR